MLDMGFEPQVRVKYFDLRDFSRSFQYTNISTGILYIFNFNEKCNFEFRGWGI